MTTGVVNAETHGTLHPTEANSRASVADVNVLAGTVAATLIESSCTADANGVTGTTNLVQAAVLDMPVEVAPPPNTVLVDTPLLRVVLNEQIVTDGQIVVNAVHVTTFDPITGLLAQDVIIASSQCSFHAADAPPPAGSGYLEVCKRADDGNGAVTGKFRFRFNGRQVTVPVGQCSGPIRVPAGRLTVTEAAKDGVRMSGCVTRPVQRLLRCDPANRKAVVRIVAGGVANETVLFVTNKRTVVGSNTGAIKVCKIAGNGVRVGTNFGFSVGNKNLTVPAGPANQGGYCKIAYGFDRGSNVRVTENARSGVHVSRITVRPVARKVSANKANRTATVKVGKGFTVVSFTNTAN